ncbi:MAG: hypothetical protein JSW49_01230 [candidate division WOR-3 bacterium]|nr:MAG: hypothetical protein JSW49_01230 [candidate division WOR-3 bacterium]
MVRADSKILSAGGVILLLPFLIYSYNVQGVSLAYNLTNNINQYNMSSGGHVAGLRPYIFLEDVVTFNYEGDFSLINLAPENLLIANSAAIGKDILLPGVGNRTALYARYYSFYAPSYDLYGVTDVALGDSLRLYAGNYLLKPDVRVRYKYYHSELVTDYLEPRAKISVRIPLPYAYFTPEVSGGFRSYGEELTPFYTTSAWLLLPLSLNLSFSTIFTFHRAVAPDSLFIVPSEYIDDPFFEEENVEETYDLEFGLNKSLIRERAFIEGRVKLFRKKYYEVSGMGRRDEGINIALQYTRFVDSKFVFHVKASTLMNASTVNDFDFMKNDLELIFELIF